MLDACNRPEDYLKRKNIYEVITYIEKVKAAEMQL
jgi:hypothetical protein